MAHFAKVENGIVTDVIVAEQDFIDTLEDKEKWLQTSYNTRGGVHYEPNTNTPSKDGVPLRKNYAGIGYTYDKNLDAFIPPQPYKSWILNQETCLWIPIISKPDNHHYWSEEDLQWKPIDYVNNIEVDLETESLFQDISIYYNNVDLENFKIEKIRNYVYLFSKEINTAIMNNSNHEKITNADFVKNAKGDVFIAGLGLGMIVLAIQDKPEVTSITIIEKFEDLKNHLQLVLPLNSKVNIIVSDIFEYQVPENTKYDTIYFDIYGDIELNNTWFFENYTQYKRNEDSYIKAWLPLPNF
jgi:hypothetical protein